MALHTLLGGNGTIATDLIPVLQSAGQQIRLVSRTTKTVPSTESIAADSLNPQELKEAVKGSDYVYLLIGLEYNKKIWQRDWPVIMRNTIEACKETRARLIFFDNVYMYGKVAGPMTETSPFKPDSEKGKVRAAIDELLMKEVREGKLKALIATSADFYGPGANKTSVVGLLVFDKLKKGQRAICFSRSDQPHSYTYTPDAAKALYMLARTESAYGQTWHLPTARPAITAREFNAIAAKYLHAKNKLMVLPSWLIRTIGWFDPLMKELGEMLYQNEYPYLFDSTKFEQAFQFQPTTYEDGIQATAAWFAKS